MPHGTDARTPRPTTPTIALCSEKATTRLQQSSGIVELVDKQSAVLEARQHRRCRRACRARLPHCGWVV